MIDELSQQQQENTNVHNSQVKTVNIDIEVSSMETKDSNEETMFDFIEFLHNDTINFLQSLLKKTSYNLAFRQKLLSVAKTYHKNFQRFSNNALSDTSAPLKNKIISNVMDTSIDMLYGLVWQAFNASEKSNRNERKERIKLSHDLHSLRTTNQDRVCEMFHVCPPQLGFKYFALKISTLLLNTTDKGKVQSLWNSCLDVMLNVNYSGVLLTPDSTHQIRYNIASRYLDSPSRVQEYLEKVKLYTETGKPLRPSSNESIIRLQTYEKFFEELNELLPGTKENWKIWNKLEIAIKEYLNGLRPNTEPEFREFVNNIIDTAVSAKVIEREKFKHRLDSLIHGA